MELQNIAEIIRGHVLDKCLEQVRTRTPLLIINLRCYNKIKTAVEVGAKSLACTYILISNRSSLLRAKGRGFDSQFGQTFV